MKKHDFAILVLSCDKYSDLWKPFFSQFNKFWPDCPYPVYLGTNTVRYPDPSIRIILSGPGVDWSSDLLSILSRIKEKYIFIWIDDFFPIKNIDTRLFKKCFLYMKTIQANHIHMNASIKPDFICENHMFGKYQRKAPYRVSVSGFWDKEHLKKILIPGENPWKFEIMGSYRSSYYDGYFCINTPLFEFIRVVEKGRINRDVYDYCSIHKIELDTSKRIINSKFVTLINNINDAYFRTVIRFPWRSRVGFIDILRKMIISY